MKNSRKINVIYSLVSGMLILVSATGMSQPQLIGQPTNQSVSLGANASFQVAAVTTNPPLSYQWRLASTNLASATSAALLLTNIQILNSGDYDVTVSDTFGSVTSQVAHLEVDPTFTKILSGRIVNDAGVWGSCAWGDYDDDGFIDLFVGSAASSTGAFQRNALYHNNADGTFARITTGTLISEAGNWRGCAWADYDEDGHLDLIVTSVEGTGFPDQAFLYRNNGNGTFTKTTAAVLGAPLSGGFSEECVWADYDHDGFLDLYVARNDGTDWLLHNNGDGTLIRVTNNIGILPDNQDNYGGVWGDYDGDGWPDLFVAAWNQFGTNQNNRLYRNNRDGTFTQIVDGSIVTDNEHSTGASWVDYDNDGYLDMFVINGLDIAVTNSVYHNNGDGTFTKGTALEVGSIAADADYFATCTWGDYDNDGFLDVFVTTVSGTGNYLYHNDGNGFFTRVLSGSPSNDKGGAYGCAWADYDNDGFLDLFVTRGGHTVSTNLLYHNNGNSNGWLKVRLVGVASNRSGIGAKIRVKATIGNHDILQLREITAGNGYSSSPLEAHFGLGDATNINWMQIEWPSGIVQIMTNVAPRTSLTIVEHQDRSVTSINISGVERADNGIVTMAVSGNPGFIYLVEGSTNLVNWSKIGVQTNTTGSMEFRDVGAPKYKRRFYRASVP